MGLFQSAIIIILASLNFFPIYAQLGITQLGGRAEAMGNASVALEDNFSPFNNLAASASIKEVIAISSFRHAYNFSPFNRVGAGFIYPSKFGTWSFTAQRLGLELYNEQHYGLGFSNKIGLVSLGLKLDYIQYHIEESGTKGVPGLSFGGIAQLLPDFTFGAYIFNLTQSALSKESSVYVPVVLRSGLSYKPVQELIFCLEAEKEVDQKVSIKGGLEYEFLEKFQLRSGISSYPFQQHYGIGFSPAYFSIDYALQNHKTLGLSHQVSIAYIFRKR